MSCRDKHVIAWNFFEIGDGILYTEDDITKICRSLGLIIHESFILPSKRKRDNVKRKTENVNEDTIGNEIVTSDQPVNAMQGTFSYAEPGCTKIFHKYLNLKSHILFGIHTTFLNRWSAFDDVKNKWK
jgi:hypothetical protein